METFIEKFRNSYRLSETDTQTLLNYMEEVRFKRKKSLFMKVPETEIYI